MTLAGLLVSAACAQIKVGDVFPSLADAGLSGPRPETAGRVLLVDFWASWCAPCKASFPAYAQLHAQYRDRGLTIVAIGVDEKPAAYAAFIKKMQPPFATLHDRDQKLVSRVQVPAMPTCYLVDRAGRVRYIHEGYHGADTAAELRREIESVIGENQQEGAR